MANFADLQSAGVSKRLVPQSSLTKAVGTSRFIHSSLPLQTGANRYEFFPAVVDKDDPFAAYGSNPLPGQSSRRHEELLFQVVGSMRVTGANEAEVNDAIAALQNSFAFATVEIGTSATNCQKHVARLADYGNFYATIKSMTSAEALIYFKASDYVPLPVMLVTGPNDTLDITVEMNVPLATGIAGLPESGSYLTAKNAAKPASGSALQAARLLLSVNQTVLDKTT